MQDPQQQQPPHAQQARTWRRYLRFFGHRGVADLDDELAFHVDMRVLDYMSRGMSEADARAATLQRLGDLTRARAACAAVATRTQRRMTRTQLLDSLSQDLRFALRTLGRNKGWTAVAIITLALGIGANSGMFSVVNHLLLNPISYPHANRVAIVFQAPVAGNTTGHMVMITPKTKLLQAWREHARSLEAIEPFVATDVTLERAGDEPRIAKVASVLPSFPAFAGRRPLLGRMFTEAEAKGEATVALISEGTWRTHYGARRDALGSTLILNGKVATVIGVLPAGLELPRGPGSEVDVWQPLDMARHEYGMLAVARVREGVTKETAQSELDAIAQRPEVKTADLAAYKTMLKSPAELVGFRQSLILLSVAVALVLLIACANVVHLLLARASSRQRELAIRAAIGAGRGRLFRQLLTESMLLSLAGCVAGVALGWAGVRALVAVRPESLGDLAAVRMDGSTLLLTAGIAVLTGLVFGVVGAVQAARHSTHDALKAGSLATSAGRGRGRARALLVVTEMALCTLLLVGATLLLRSVMHLQRLDPGFDPRGMYALDLNIPDDRYPTPAAKQAFDAEAVRRARQIPGVEAVTLVASAPPSATFLLGVIQVEGQPTPASDAAGFLRFNGVSPDYFRLMRMPIVEGTTFTDTTDAGGQMIVNASMARQLWPGQSPIGKRLRVVYSGQGEWKTVVGVVGDARLSGLTSDASEGILYGPGVANFRPAIIVRARGDNPGVAAALAGVMSGIDRRLPPPRVTSIEEALRRSVARPRFTLFLLSAFAMVAVGLAAVGLYGVLAYNVAQRTREIGIRMALGASRHSVARAVIAQGLLMAIVGSAIGLLVARGGVKLLAHTLYGVQQTDLLSFAGAAVALVVIAAAACLIPARRAVAVDPLIAMRAE